MSSSKEEAEEKGAVGPSVSSEPNSLPSRHVEGTEEKEEERGNGTAIEGSTLPTCPPDAEATPGVGGSPATEPTEVSTDPPVEAGTVAITEWPQGKIENSEEHGPPDDLCNKEERSSSPSDPSTVSSVVPSVPPRDSCQSEVQKNEDLPSGVVSTDVNLSSDLCSKVIDESGHEADQSLSTLESSSKSHQGSGGGQTENESSPRISGGAPHGKSDESDVSDDKISKDGNQTHSNVLPDEKGATAGDTTDGAAKAESVPTSSTDGDDEKQSIYHVKWIKHKGTTTPIITQNENGPCPLLAIMNLLLLQAKIKLPSSAEVVTSNELMAHLADWIFEHVPKNISEDTRLNYEQNMHDAIAVFPRLQTGLDVNVRFAGVSQFEYTPECIVFDLLDIPLYHGWLVDPQAPDLVSAIGNRTYNQLVEKIIVQKNSNKEELVAEALLAEDFLNVTASQLTYHGLSELSATIKDEEMCVLFRNNHFSTLVKHKNELFVLVTDQGFLRESNVVWETLSNIEGDGHFVDSEFRTYRLPETAASSLPASSFPINSKDQIDHDYLVALSLEQEQSELQPSTTWSGSATLSDHELALRLQEEENMSADSSLRQQQPAARQQKPDATAAAAAGSSIAAAGSGSSSSVPSKDKKENRCSLM